MPNATFVLKEPNANNDTLVYLLYRYNGQKLKFSTSQKIHPKFWNEEKQRAKETRQFPGFIEFNSLLNSLEHRVSDGYRKLLNDGISPTPDKLRKILNEALYKEDTTLKNDLIAFARNLILNSTKKRETIANYKQAVRILEEFKNYKNVTILFDSINLDFYEDFMKFCLNKAYSTNTIGGLIKNIKVFMNEAYDRGFHKNLDHKRSRFKKVEEESEAIYLTQDEIRELHTLDLLENQRLDRVRDLFVIGCYTGLRYSDLSRLNEKDLIDKTKIKVKTEKTGEIVIIPIHPYVKTIFEKYDWKLTKPISNQKMNSYLKELGELAGFKNNVSISMTKGGNKVTQSFKKFELITVHTARRSFATNAYLNHVPTISIMKITGHRTERAFLRYIKISQEDNANKLLNHPFFK